MQVVRRGRGVRLGPRGLRVVLCGVWLVMAVSVAAQGPLAAQIKVAMIYRFLQFTQWPQSALTAETERFRLCVLGRDRLAYPLAALQGRRAHGRPIAWVKAEDARQLQRCHAVYVARSHAGRLNAVLVRWKDRPVLTIADIDEFTEHGGVIALTRVADRLSFIVNTQHARQARLEINPQMLRIAHEVD